eukprot:CAMPEP_0115032558 /NCGR_PEP_ID=MMETSP0216-20121206/39235_1 /TAXON_ID=223996 /ORGANISM="Protocruzia adherens, Strain Boccale" /LENGTH=176 /DNA_ID=CAMNT_0002410491 /DNA_START=205 /DNA_END=735 /DNA_ORIENTATION=-
MPSHNLSPNNIHYITPPGQLDGGDVMKVDNSFYVGLSTRTNDIGARQFLELTERLGFVGGGVIELPYGLHLKSLCSYIEGGNLLCLETLADREEWKGLNVIVVPQNETAACNCVWVNGTVLMPTGCPETKKVIQQLGYEVIEVENSEFAKVDCEFAKVDGCLTCRSVIFSKDDGTV